MSSAISRKKRLTACGQARFLRRNYSAKHLIEKTRSVFEIAALRFMCRLCGATAPDREKCFSIFRGRHSAFPIISNTLSKSKPFYNSFTYPSSVFTNPIFIIYFSCPSDLPVKTIFFIPTSGRCLYRKAPTVESL